MYPLQSLTLLDLCWLIDHLNIPKIMVVPTLDPCNTLTFIPFQSDLYPLKLTIFFS